MLEFEKTYTDGTKTLKVIEDSTDSVYSVESIQVRYTDDQYKKILFLCGFAIDEGVTVEIPFTFTYPVEEFNRSVVTSCIRIYKDGIMELVAETEYGKLVTEEMSI